MVNSKDVLHICFHYIQVITLSCQIELFKNSLSNRCTCKDVSLSKEKHTCFHEKFQILDKPRNSSLCQNISNALSIWITETKHIGRYITVILTPLCICLFTFRHVLLEKKGRICTASHSLIAFPIRIPKPRSQCNAISIKFYLHYQAVSRLP